MFFSGVGALILVAALAVARETLPAQRRIAGPSLRRPMTLECATEAL